MRIITIQAALAAGLLALASGGCGGASSGSSHASGKPAPGSASSSGSGGSASITSGPVHATLTAANHTPIVGKDWAYSVHVTNAQGRPLPGTVKIEFSFGGAVVGTDHPPTHPLSHGVWRDTLTFPRQAVGYPLTFEAVVRTTAGSVTLSWPVTVRS